MPQIVALARTLADAGKDRIAAVLGGDVSDQFLDQYRFADARAAEQTDLAALSVGGKQVDNLDAGLEDLYNGALIRELRRLSVDLPIIVRLNVSGKVDRLAENIEHSAERRLADRHPDTAAGRGDLHTLAQSVGGCQHDRADDMTAHMLGDLHHTSTAVEFNGESVLDHGELPIGKLHVDNGAQHL